MKKILLATVLFCFAFAANAQKDTAKSDYEDPKIKFMETSHDFGEINEGDVVEHKFKFKNEGKRPLVISNVTTTCGCTVPSWPKKPIGVGEEAVIHAKFNSSGKSGTQNKAITVISNAPSSPDRVYLKGKVTKKDKKQ